MARPLPDVLRCDWPAETAEPPPATLAALDRAAAVLRSGGLVAIPTETVYGLAADALDEFAVDRERLVPGPDDLYGQPGYRFWIVVRSGTPLVAVDQRDATAWSATGGPPFSLVELYQQAGRDVAVVAGEVLRRGG